MPEITPPQRKFSLKCQVALTALATVIFLFVAIAFVLSLNLNRLGTTLFLSAIVSALAIGVLRIVSAGQSRPLLNLIDQINHLQQERLGWSLIEVGGGDEAEQLAKAFTALIEKTNKAEMALREQAQLHRVVAEFTNELAVWLNPDGSFRYISPNCEEITGYRADSFYQDPVLFDSLIHPEDREQWLSHNHSKNQGSSLFLRIINPAGQTLWFNHTCHEVHDDDGTPLGIRENFNDVTVSMLMANQLSEEARIVENIINSASAPIFVINASHRVLFWNKALEAMTAIPAGKVKGTDQHWSAFYGTKRPTLADLIIDKGQNFLALYDTVLPSPYAEGGLQTEGWYEFSGQRRYLLFEAAPVFGIDNEIIAAVETFKDLTHEKMAKDELNSNRRELEKKHGELEAIFAKVEKGKREWEVSVDHLRDFIILTDPGHRILRANKLLAEVTGLPIKKLLGYEWSKLLVGSGFEFVNFDGVKGELIHQPTVSTYDINIYEVRNETIFDGYIVSLKNTTELRGAKEALEKAYAELKDAQLQIYQQEKLASIGQLAAGVAHEINNPLGFVSSNLSTLAKHMARLIDYSAAMDKALAARCEDAGKEQVRALRKSLKIDYIIDDFPQLMAESRDGMERVRRIVQDLKGFSRIDQTECIPIDLNEALETTIHIAWNEIKYTATLSKEYGEIPLLSCYPQQLNQVFLNLLINAAQAVEAGKGEIAVRTWCEGETVCISISDNGAGIPVEIQPRIFEPFFTTKQVGKGTGLGLSVSYDIIRKHGGEIRLESKPGEGATFIVRLPLQRICQEQR